MPCRCARRPFRQPTHRSRRLGRPVGFARLRFPHFCALDAGNASDVGVKSASSSSAPGIFTPSVLFVRCSARFSSALRLPRFSFAWFARVGRPSRRLARGVHSFYSFVLFVRFIRSFYSLVRASIRSFVRSLARWYARSLARWCARSVGTVAHEFVRLFHSLARTLFHASLCTLAARRCPCFVWPRVASCSFPRPPVGSARPAAASARPLPHAHASSVCRSFVRSFVSLARSRTLRRLARGC